VKGKIVMREQRKFNPWEKEPGYEKERMKGKVVQRELEHSLGLDLN